MRDNAPIRVLQVIDAFGVGGAETWLMEVLRLWSRTGAGRMDFLITSGRRGVFDDEAAHLGARIHYVRYGRADLVAFVRRFRRILSMGRYDAIHDHSDYASGWHFLMGAGVLPSVRVSHVHNPWLHIQANYAISRSRRMATSAGERLTHRLATHICGTSEEILETYGFRTGTSRRRPAVSVVHCGIDVAKFNGPSDADRRSVLEEFGWPHDSKVVLFAGRLDRALEFDHPQNHKNSWFALHVVRTALQSDPSVRLLMAGAGDDSRIALEGCVREWAMADRLRLIGVRHDVPRLMRAANALLFPSRQEGLGMVAVEAQAAGLPVLMSTAVPREAVVVRELVDAVPLHESIEHWGDALLHRIAKPRPSMESCRRLLDASEFSIVRSALRLEAIYTGNHA